jgi:tripartite-type tricarboxylate transporter receptor subunit TctC
MHRRTLLSAAGGLALAPLAAPRVLAQPAWPSRPITMVAPLAAGSSVDIIARIVAQEWSQRLGQPVVVENRPSANGTVALGQVGRAAPDGYTATIVAQPQVAINPYLYTTLPYDPLKSFALITRLTTGSNALVVAAASPFRSVADIVAAARAKPGTLTYSSGGVGSTHHISSAMLAQQARLDLTHVPYRGAPQGIIAVQTGEVDFAFYNLPTLLPGVRSGQLRALAVASPERTPFLPDVPTMKEAGFPDYELTFWSAVATVAGTPEPIVNRFYEATRDMLDSPATQKILTDAGFELAPTLTPADMRKLAVEDHDRLGPVIRATGARLD